MDYGFYKSAYGGTLIPPELFNRFLFKAQTYLDSITIEQAIPSDYAEKFSFALCEIAEVYFLDNKNGNIKSENTDGYSVSYSDKELSASLLEIADLYLGESGLLYRGERL